MSEINFSVYETNLEKYTAEAISACLRQNTNKHILFLISGGSAFKVLNYVNLAVFGKNITVSLVDERFSKDAEISNFLQLIRTKFYKNAKARGVKFISSLPEKDERLEDVSNRLEKIFRQWGSAYPSNRVIMAIMGIGLDGHTAGIMPFPEDPYKFSNLFENEVKWIVGYDAGNKNQYPVRMTISISFLKSMIDYAFVYVSGENKKDILKTIMKSDEIAKYPASVFHLMKHVELYTDIAI